MLNFDRIAFRTIVIHLSDSFYDKLCWTLLRDWGARSLSWKIVVDLNCFLFPFYDCGWVIQLICIRAVNVDFWGFEHLPTRFFWCIWPLICWIYSISDWGVVHIVWSAWILRHFSVLSVLFLNLNMMGVFCRNEYWLLFFSVVTVVKADFLGNMDVWLKMMPHLWDIVGISIRD